MPTVDFVLCTSLVGLLLSLYLVVCLQSQSIIVNALAITIEIVMAINVFSWKSVRDQMQMRKVYLESNANLSSFRADADTDI